jgi:Mg-chelatase subunit ChlD
MVMVDVSQSMLVQDMPKQTSRLAATKEIITSLLKKNTQARRGI